MWKKPLLCSFEATMSPDLVFPDDGVCDISFFQAHEENHTLLRGEESEYDVAFDAFVKAAAKQTITEHGVSLDCHNYNNSAEAMKEPASTKTIKELWGKKMYHWASMNTYLAVAKEMLITLYHVMKDIKRIIKEEIKPSRAHYFVYTGTLRRPQRIKYELGWFKTLMWMDGVVALAHTVENDRPWSSGRMMPPTFWFDLQLPAVYRSNMRTAHSGIAAFSKEDVNGTAFYVSLSLAARCYVPDEKYAFRAEMVDSAEPLLVPIMDYCKDKEYHLGFQDKDPVGGYYVSQTKERFITFDDSRSLGMKFCRGKKNLTDLRYGLLAFNTELDDPNNECGKGSYQRLKFLRKLVDFFYNNFTTPSAWEMCVKLT